MITESAKVRLRRPKVAVLVIGQSNEQGPLSRAEEATYPLAFRSAINPAVCVPLNEIGVVGRGGWWPYVYDSLWAWGYDLQIVNAAVGGMSLLGHCTGAVQSRVNSLGYHQARASAGYPDRGDFGDVIQIAGKTFKVTAGRRRAAFNTPPQPSSVGTSGYQDFVAFAGSEISAVSPPDVSATPVDGEATDGGLTLKRLADRYAAEATFYPGQVAPAVNGGALNYNFGGVMGERNAGHGFDPLGILSRALDLGSRVAAERRIVYFSQGQSDLGAGRTTYGRAVMIATNYFLARGWEVMIGNTCFSPASSGANDTNYMAQVNGVADAIAALAAYYPGKVHMGANLYALMGSTGPMASGGAFMQADNVHLSGAGLVGPTSGGVQPAGQHVADAFKAVLPRLVA